MKLPLPRRPLSDEEIDEFFAALERGEYDEGRSGNRLSLEEHLHDHFSTVASFANPARYRRFMTRVGQSLAKYLREYVAYQFRVSTASYYRPTSVILRRSGGAFMEIPRDAIEDYVLATVSYQDPESMFMEVVVFACVLCVRNTGAGSIPQAHWAMLYSPGVSAKWRRPVRPRFWLDLRQHQDALREPHYEAFRAVLGVCTQCTWTCQSCGTPLPITPPDPEVVLTVLNHGSCAECLRDRLVNLRPPKPGRAELRAFVARFRAAAEPGKTAAACPHCRKPPPTATTT